MFVTRTRKHFGDLAPLTLLCFLLLLLLSAAVAVALSHYKLFWTDELLEFFSDSKPSVGRIILDQYRAPFSLEPPFFHILLHVLEKLIRMDKIAARLPSIFALLLTQASVFFVTGRATRSDRSALVSMTVPFVLVTVDYAAEARVYGLLTGCFAFALFCWQRATTTGRNRGGLLAALFLALAIAMLTHFYAIFLAIPLWFAEVSRSLERKQVDWPVFLALLLGTGTLLLDLPFMHALAPFRQHYNPGEAAWSNIAFTYFWFWDHFWAYHRAPAYLLRGEWIATLVLTVLICFSLFRIRGQWRKPGSSASLEIALSTAALLPVLNVVAAQFTKAYVPRYSLPAVAGIAVLFGLMLHQIPAIRRAQVLLIPVAVWLGLHYIRGEIKYQKWLAENNMNGMHLTDPERDALQRNPDHHIYVQNVARMLILRYYAPPELQKVITGMYSIPCDLHWTGRDPGSLFAQNMAATANVPFVSFAAVHDTPGPHLLYINHDPTEEWIGKELQAEQVTPQYLGPALWGDLYAVTFNPNTTCDSNNAPLPAQANR